LKAKPLTRAQHFFTRFLIYETRNILTGFDCLDLYNIMWQIQIPPTLAAPRLSLSRGCNALKFNTSKLKMGECRESLTLKVKHIFNESFWVFILFYYILIQCVYSREVQFSQYQSILINFIAVDRRSLILAYDVD